MIEKTKKIDRTFIKFSIISGVISFGYAAIIISGFLYKYGEGQYALIGYGILFLIAAVWAGPAFKTINYEKKDMLSLGKVFKSVNKRIFIFCFIVFIQSFAAGPMWDFIIPMYCYNVLMITPAVLGVLMSMDELIGGPTFIIAGHIVDKINTVKFNVVFIILTAVCGFFIIRSKTLVPFIIMFLICSVSISCTFVGIPKQRIAYVNKKQKGFELALISVCGSLGYIIGNKVYGGIAEKYSIEQSLMIFVICYLLMAGLILLPSALKIRKE